MVEMSSTASHQSQGPLHLQRQAALYRLGMTIGERIKKARLDKGLSLEKLGDLLGVTRQAVNQWEKGESDPAKRIEALSEHLGKPLEYFYGAKRDPDDLADQIAQLDQDQQDIIRRMVKQMLGQAEKGQGRKIVVK
jgi:transcriptional regulator with XRE-family HTH domain